jgi:membrane fusion protein, multidrug efflux system
MARPVLGGLALVLIAVAVVFAVPDLREWVSGWVPASVASQPEPAAVHEPQARPVPVRVAVAAKRNVPIYLQGVGTVTARSTVAIRSRIEGQLFEALVREGQTVRKGDILFRLDPRPLQASLKQAEADLAGDRARHAKAVADVARLSSLAAKGYAPHTQVDDAKAVVDTAAATIRAAQAAVELAQLNLDYATIRSPIDGRAGTILVTPGNMVKPNDTQPLLIITEIKPIFVSFGVPEQYIDEVRARMAVTQLPVEVSTQASAEPVTGGELFFINNQVDASTGTIELMARFANENERLVAGQFVRARVLLSSLDAAVVVPSRAVQINQQGHYLWVVSPNGTVELRSVTTGPDSGDDVVIAQGLAVGEKVVTDGQLRLVPGAKVTPGGEAAAARVPGAKPSRSQTE